MPLLDLKMSKDLKELYNIGQISAAVSLNSAGVLSWPCSTKGKPGYFGGDRNAKTIMVMLNPGGNASGVDGDYKTVILPSKKWHPKHPYTWHDFKSYYDLFQDLSAKGGTYDRTRSDYFDLKQAAFLKRWQSCGVSIPPVFPGDKTTFLDAKENVLNQKLQLELIPYASDKFEIIKKNIHHIFPYLDIIFDEIFSKEREYVIFAAGLFEGIFQAYNKVYGNVIDLSIPKQITPSSLKPGGKLKGSCKVIHIKYKGKSHKAIIANTFPSRALSYALEPMVKYGEFCYNVYKKTP